MKNRVSRKKFQAVVQPDYEKWRLVSQGMSKEDVVDVLGKPLNAVHRGRSLLDLNSFVYGHLKLPMTPDAQGYEFRIGFNAKGHVEVKIDPFNGDLSADGIPSTPSIISPTNQSTFQHFPRIVDVRWSPSSGEYPMTYTVELCTLCNEHPQQVVQTKTIDELEAPFVTTVFGGAQPGQLRVRGANAKGVSVWSEPRHFLFTI